MTRPTLRAQANWAKGQAAQHARLAARNPAGSAARRLAEERHAIAEAAAASLLNLASKPPRKEPAPCPTPRPPLRFLPPKTPPEDPRPSRSTP